MSKNLEFITTY
jgi:hypothetical protein